MARSIPAPGASASRPSRRARPSMTDRQLQAYLLAREMLRRLRSPASPAAPDDSAGRRRRVDA